MGEAKRRKDSGDLPDGGRVAKSVKKFVAMLEQVAGVQRQLYIKQLAGAEGEQPIAEFEFLIEGELAKAGQRVSGFFLVAIPDFSCAFQTDQRPLTLVLELLRGLQGRRFGWSFPSWSASGLTNDMTVTRPSEAPDRRRALYLTAMDPGSRYQSVVALDDAMPTTLVPWRLMGPDQVEMAPWADWFCTEVETLLERPESRPNRERTAAALAALEKAYTGSLSILQPSLGP